jgi:hypothetical protein
MLCCSCGSRVLGVSSSCCFKPSTLSPRCSGAAIHACSRSAGTDVNGARADVEVRTATHCLCRLLRRATLADCQLQRSRAAFPLLTVDVSTTHCSQSTEPASHDQLLLLTAGTCERCCCLRLSPRNLPNRTLQDNLEAQGLHQTDA